MSALVAYPIVAPLLGAALSILLGHRRNAQRIISLVVLFVGTVVAFALLHEADVNGAVVQAAGGWSAPLGVALVVDRLSGLMLAVSWVVLLAVLVFAIGEPGEENRRVSFHPVYLVLAAGVSASFVTADLFSLFVAFEMMLASSYVLIALGGRLDQIRSGMTYVVINLVASTLFISVLGLLYSATGTVNMADLSVRLDGLEPELQAMFAIALLIVFGIKAGLFPLFFWLPDSYPTAPGPVVAVFAGLLTKVGVYAIIRTQTLLFGESSWMGTVLLVVAALTMTVGVLGAIAQDDMKRILAFHIISQIGYMILGLGLFSVAGLAGAVFYIVHHIVVKTALFLVAGLVAVRSGSTRLSEIGGLVRSAPAVALVFAVPALGLAGMPPFSGFLAKLAIVDSGLAAGAGWAVGISLGVGLLTLYSMTKIWSGVFWGEPEIPVDDDASSCPIPRSMLVATGALGLVSVAFSVMAGPIYRIAQRAAVDLLDPAVYVSAVLGGGS